MGFRDLYGSASRGIVTPEAARRHGVAESTYHHRKSAEGWVSPFRGTASLPGAPLDKQARMLAAVTAIGPPVVLTGWTAAHVRGIVATAPTRVEVLVPASRRPRRAGVRVRRTRAWEDDRPEHLAGLPLASWPRMVADLAEDTDDDWLTGVVLTGYADGSLAPGDLALLLGSRARFPGRTRLRRVAARCRPDGSESGFERLARRRLAAAGLAADDGQVEVAVPTGTRRVDIAWRRQRVGVECHSWRYHGSRAAFESDAVRRNDLLAVADWIVLDLTWRTLELDWPRFLHGLRTVLDRREPGAGQPA